MKSEVEAAAGSSVEWCSNYECCKLDIGVVVELRLLLLSPSWFCLLS